MEAAAGEARGGAGFLPPRPPPSALCTSPLWSAGADQLADQPRVR